MSSNTNKEGTEAEVHRTRAQALKGLLQQLSKRSPRPNIQATIVIALSIAGVIALVGDIPLRQKTPTLERTTIEFSYDAPWIQTWVVSPDGYFVTEHSLLELSVSLPAMPRKHATIYGEYSFRGYAYTSGVYKLIMSVPEPASLTVESDPIRPSDTWQIVSGSQLESYLKGLVEEGMREAYNIIPGRRKLVEFTFPNSVSCDTIAATFRFSTNYGHFSRPHGWARQDVTILWTAPTPTKNLSREAESDLVSRCTDGEEQELNGKNGILALSIGDGQRFEPIFPQPSFPTPYVFVGTPVYEEIPEPQSPPVAPTRIAATIENETGRFWASLAIQLLLLGVGALLGGTAFRVTGNERGKRPAPKDLPD